MPSELTDADVFGSQEMSDAEVFGGAELNPNEGYQKRLQDFQARSPVIEPLPPVQFQDLSAGQTPIIRAGSDLAPMMQTTTQGPRGEPQPLGAYEQPPEVRQQVFEKQATQPIIPLPKFKVEPEDNPILAAGKEAVNLAVGIPEFIESPAGILTAGAGAVAPTATAVAFTADMLYNVGKQLLDTYKNWRQMTKAQKAVAAVDVLGTTGLAGLTTTAAVRGIRSKVTPQLAGEPNAIETRVQPEGSLGEYPGVPPRENLPAYNEQVRQGEGERASGGGGIVPSPESQRLPPQQPQQVTAADLMAAEAQRVAEPAQPDMPPSETFTPPKPSDYERYQQILKQIEDMPGGNEKYRTPEYMALSQAVEDIKQKYGGFPPPSPAAAPEAVPPKTTPSPERFMVTNTPFKHGKRTIEAGTTVQVVRAWQEGNLGMAEVIFPGARKSGTVLLENLKPVEAPTPPAPVEAKPAAAPAAEKGKLGQPADEFGSVFGPDIGKQGYEKLKGTSFEPQELPSDVPNVTHKLQLKGNKLWLTTELASDSPFKPQAVTYLQVKPSGETVLGGSFSHPGFENPKLAELGKAKLVQFINDWMSGKPKAEKPAIVSTKSLPTPAPPEPKGKGVKPNMLKERAAQRPWDIIDEIRANIGSIRSKGGMKPGQEGYFGELYKDAASGPARQLFSKTGQGPDEVVDSLRRARVLPEDATVDDLWDALSKANSVRRKYWKGEQPEQITDKFYKALERNFAKKSKQVLTVGDLAIGDKFKIQGEELEVVHIDPDTGEVTVKDGRKFRSQTVPDGADLAADAGSFKPVERQPVGAQFPAEEEKPTLTLEKPETVEEQNARLATERAAAEKKQAELAAAEAVRAKAAQRIGGNLGSAGQGGLFPEPGQQEIFAPKPPTQTGGQPPIIGMGGAAKGELDSPGTYVSNMFAVIDQDRAALGKPPMPPGKTRTWSDDEATALARMNRDPEWIPDLIQEVTKKPRPLLSWEQAGMVFQKAKWRAEANNAMRTIAEAADSGRAGDLAEARVNLTRYEDNLAAMEKAVGRGGTGSEAGRTLQAQKMGLTDDLTLVEMRLGLRAKKGGERLTPEEEKWVEDLFNRSLTADAKIAALEQQKVKLAADYELARLKAESKPTEHPDIIIKTAEKIVAQLDRRADAARARLRGKLLSPSPQDLLDIAEIGASHIAHVGLDFAKWSDRMVTEFGEKIKPYLDRVFKMAQDGIDKLAVSEPVKRKVKNLTPEEAKQELVNNIHEKIQAKKNDEIAFAVRKLARVLYAEGIREREAMVDSLHEVIPELSRREVMDAFSGYGNFKQLGKDEITVALRGMKGELQQIAKLEDMAAGQPPLKSGLERRTPTEAERQLIKLVNDAKYTFQVPITDPATQLKSALDTRKTMLRNKILDYQDRLARGDFSKRPRRELLKDREVLQLEADKERIRRQYQQGLRKYELANRKPWQKFADAFVKWERAFKLSSPVVFGKLGAAAVTRLVTTGVEEAVGAGLSKIPGISRIAKGSPREGLRTGESMARAVETVREMNLRPYKPISEYGANIRAMAEGLTEAFTTGMRDAAQTAKTGITNLDVLLGEKGGMDPDWANFFGQLHGMMKAPIKRFEYTLSLEKRIAHAIENGVDVTDPLVQTRLMTEALNDGYRTIFMQRGFSADMFNTLVMMMEKNKNYQPTGYIAARTLRFLLPIVRVPINIVAETATGVHGLATASARTMFYAMKGGLDNMPPEVADSIMRQFKKGAIGAGLMAIGYFNPQFAGGYDWREKRKPGEVKTGGFQIFGKDVPRWLTHAPWFELMQIGATIRHVKQQHVKGQERGIGEGMWAAAFGLLEQTPFYGEMVRASRAAEGTSQRTQFLGELARGTFVPQAVQKIASMTDKDVKRKPKTIWEHMKMGIPGLRQQVPVQSAGGVGLLPPPSPLGYAGTGR